MMELEDGLWVADIGKHPMPRVVKWQALALGSDYTLGDDDITRETVGSHQGRRVCVVRRGDVVAWEVSELRGDEVVEMP